MIVTLWKSLLIGDQDWKSYLRAGSARGIDRIMTSNLRNIKVSAHSNQWLALLARRYWTFLDAPLNNFSSNKNSLHSTRVPKKTSISYHRSLTMSVSAREAITGSSSPASRPMNTWRSLTNMIFHNNSRMKTKTFLTLINHWHSHK